MDPKPVLVGRIVSLEFHKPTLLCILPMRLEPKQSCPPVGPAGLARPCQSAPTA